MILKQIASQNLCRKRFQSGENTNTLFIRSTLELIMKTYTADEDNFFIQNISLRTSSWTFALIS